jgi:hypothetical protein
MHKISYCLILAVLITTVSCIGVSADIQMRKDGSGTITMEYRFSRMAETIGRLDGNEQWPIIPVGRADWERTVARIPDMKLVSFAAREEPASGGSDKNIVNKVTLEFKNAEAFLAFFDPAGNRAALSGENGSGSLSLILNREASSQVNADLLDLMRQVSAGYTVKISFSAAGNSTMMVTDGAGAAIAAPPEAQTVLSGKKVSLAIGTGELLSRANGLGVLFTW